MEREQIIFSFPVSFFISDRNAAVIELHHSCLVQWMEHDNNCLYYDPIWKSSRFVATTSGLSGVWFSVMYSASSAQPPWFRVNITFHPHKSGVWCRQTPDWCKQTPGLAYTDPRKRHSENSTVYHAWGSTTGEVVITKRKTAQKGLNRHGTVHNTIQHHNIAWKNTFHKRK